jgi:hypothetical protein
MQKMIRHLALVGALVAPTALAAQARGPGGPEGARDLPSASVTQILNARRALDLTPRQVAQLDSIERALFAERRVAGERMRAMRDSMGGQTGGQMRARVERGERIPPAGVRSDSARGAMRDAMRQRMEAVRPQLERMRGRDSTARAAAERVLNDAQRQQLRELRAEERGRQRGLREARGARMGARRGMRGEGVTPLMRR